MLGGHDPRALGVGEQGAVPLRDEQRRRRTVGGRAGAAGQVDELAALFVAKAAQLGPQPLDVVAQAGHTRPLLDVGHPGGAKGPQVAPHECRVVGCRRNGVAEPGVGVHEVGVAGHAPEGALDRYLHERQMDAHGDRHGLGVGLGVEVVQVVAQLDRRVRLVEERAGRRGQGGELDAGGTPSQHGLGPARDAGLQGRPQDEVVGGAHQMQGDAHERALDEQPPPQQIDQLLAAQAGHARPQAYGGGPRVLRLQAGDPFDGRDNGGVGRRPVG